MSSGISLLHNIKQGEKILEVVKDLTTTEITQLMLLKGNSMSTHTLFRIASGICQITILYHQWVIDKQNRPIKSSECPILKKLWSKWRFSPFWLSNTVFFTNRPFFNQIEQFKKEKLS